MFMFAVAPPKYASCIAALQARYPMWDFQYKNYPYTVQDVALKLLNCHQDVPVIDIKSFQETDQALISQRYR